MRQFDKIDLAAAHRPLANALAQQMSFQTQLHEVEGEISRLDARSLMGQRRSRFEEDAERLIVGEEPLPFDLEVLTSERHVLVHRRSLLIRVVALMKRRVGGEETSASRIVCENLVSEHRAIVAGIAKALIQLGRALEVERSFRENLDISGVKFISHLRPMPVPGLGQVTDTNGRLAAWFRDAFESELVSMDDIPPAWCEKWGTEFWRRPEAA